MMTWAESAWGWDAAGAWGWGDDADDSTSDLIRQLSADFAPLVSADAVRVIVEECRRELEATSAATPEALERLARQRLNDASGSYTITTVARTGPGAGSSAYLHIQPRFE